MSIELGYKKGVLAIALIIIIAAITGAYFLTSSPKTILKVFHAGSLSEVFLELENGFEIKHDGVDVQRESAGSVDTIRKVTDLGKSADIVASADYQLIESMMMESTPRYADFYIQFAMNKIVIAYTEHSSYKNEINGSNWPEILREDNVNFGFSNPNADPCGYRALMVIQLAETYYNNEFIFEDLVSNHSSISSEEEGGNHTIYAPESIDPDSKIMMRPKEVDLMGLLELGEFDYLLIYKSVAYQHRNSGVEYIELPEEVDLSAFEEKENYAKVKVVRNSDNAERRSTTVAAPIVYGITIPTNANHFELAVEFVKSAIGEEGQSVLNDLGQIPIEPPKASEVEAVPDDLKSMVVNIEED